jgi:hypothetical protein
LLGHRVVVVDIVLWLSLLDVFDKELDSVFDRVRKRDFAFSRNGIVIVISVVVVVVVVNDVD